MRLPLSNADAGLIAASTMLHEACATGLPCAAVSLSPEQAAEAQALADRGAVIDLGGAAELTVGAIESALLELSRDEVRKRLSERSQRAIDRRGRTRVVDAVLRLAQAKRGQGGQ
jgi:spore coat polysaccharide biosynthesis predicted glycosyltransferase SpsG